MSSRVFVVDTNVVVAGLSTGRADSPVAAVLDAMLRGSLLFLLSPDLIDEYRSVLLRPKLRESHGLSAAEIDQVLVELTANAMWSEPKAGSAAPDPGDDHLWSLLETHAGSILITGDQLLLRNPPSNHSVISPQAWHSGSAPSNDARSLPC